MSEPQETAAGSGGDRLRITFRGVRGSAPVSGEDHNVFGGDTICCDIGAGPRRVIVDAGSGLAALGRDMCREGPADVDILLTHYHLDHLLGLMGFGPLFSRGSRVRLHAPILEQAQPRRALDRFLDRPFFPMSAREAGADFSIRTFRPGARLAVGGFAVATCPLSHPGGACGYRIGHAGRALVVALDHEHGAPEMDGGLQAFARGADLVLYDATFDEREDYEAHRGWGHSTWQAGLALIGAAGAARLACLHHAPSSTDGTLLAREAALQARAPQSFFARQNQTIILP
jgi:phosphoribosyl 1,2-cyclic phosphodiesterase